MKYKINPLNHKINFVIAENLTITLETDRLMMRSITQEDADDCIALFGDSEVMQKFGAGRPYPAKQAQGRLDIWVHRWKAHDPYSAYAVFDKNNKMFIGIFALGHSESRGESEVITAIHKKYWGNGYLREVTSACQSLVPQLMLKGYQLDHKPLKKLTATARTDNPASQKLLQGVGFKKESKVVKFGAERFSYSIFAKHAKNNYQQFYNRLDKERQRLERVNFGNEETDVSVQEMVRSSFGRSVKLK